jgi:hypothetical protein
MLYKTRVDPVTNGVETITSHNANGVGGKTLKTNGYSGLRIDINISAFSGTSITYTVQAHHAAADVWVTLLASSAQTGTGNVDLHVDPRATAAANSVASKILTREVRVLSSGTITSVTHEVSATWVP